jgi:myo-inositol-1(or 4)-monophosphatase
MRIKMFGAACMDFSALACGRTDALVMFSKNLWDIAPGALLASEAGAYIFGLDGKEYTDRSNALIAVSEKEQLSVILGK